MTTTQSARLSAISNRSTLHEVVLVHASSGERRLLCYSTRSGAALRRYVYKRAAAVVAFTGGESIVRQPKTGTRHAHVVGDWRVEFSGRTEREAILAGELPWFGGAR